DQNDGGNDGGNVRIQNRSPGAAEALVHRRRGSFVVAQLLAYALKDQHIGIHAHTDGENHSGNPGQGERRSEVSHEAQQDDQVQDQSNSGVDTRASVVDQHEDHDRQHSYNRSFDTGADRIGSQRGTYAGLGQIMQAGGQ